MSKHTPGPWRIASPGAYQSGINIDAPTSYVCLVGDSANETAQADAKLIASAPKLLAALKGMLALSDDHEFETFGEFMVRDQTAQKVARAAIAEAEG